MSTLLAIRECTKHWTRISRNRPPPSSKPPTPTCQVTRLSISTKGVVVPTHPRYTPTKNDDIVFLESLINSIPDQAGPDHSGTGCCIVLHLGELPSVDLDSLGRREPEINRVTTAFHLKYRRAGSNICPCHGTCNSLHRMEFS